MCVSLYVCMCVYVCVGASMYECMYVCMCVYVCVCMYVCARGDGAKAAGPILWLHMLVATLIQWFRVSWKQRERESLVKAKRSLNPKPKTLNQV
jgi:hypothetical protein